VGAATGKGELFRASVDCFGWRIFKLASHFLEKMPGIPHENGYGISFLGTVAA